MQDHPLYKKLRQVIIDGAYTIKQVENATYDQVTKLLGERCALAFLTNMKHLLLSEMQDREDANNMKTVRTKVVGWLDVNFPDWHANRGREGNLPFVTIWLKGKPVVKEPE